MTETFDIAIVGAGITGCTIARQLARYDLSICVVEAANDIALGASKANGGLVHAGYDPTPGTVKAQVNARGCELYGMWAQELGFLFCRTGSMVLGFNDEDRAQLEKLRSNGLANGVPELSIVGPDRIHELEPRASADATCALWCPSTGFVDPFEVAIAALENAVANGVTLMRSAPVEAIEVADSDNGTALYAGDPRWQRTLPLPDQRRGQRHRRHLAYGRRRGVPDGLASGQHRGAGQGAAHAHAALPRADAGVEGRYRDGYRARQHRDHRHGCRARAGRHANLCERCKRAADRRAQAGADLDTRRVVRAFAGGRPVIQRTNDFFIGQSVVVPGLFQAAGIQSPGVASAPAIAERMELAMREAGVELHERADWNPIRRAPDDFDRAPLARKEELIESDPAWGQIVCRCETVPEAEIVAAIRRQPGAVSVEGVKRRCRAGMGRCQSGFCQSRVVAILARELGCDPSEVLLEDAGSWLVEGPLKGVR